MPKLLQINVTANQSSHGKIAEEIGRLALADGWQSWMAYGRGKAESSSKLIRIGGRFSVYEHFLEARHLDFQGRASRFATRRFVEKLKAIDPDIIHLHNLHGYYLNYKILFKALREMNKPVVWTLHDCWAFTGHCAYFDIANCAKWQTSCGDCDLRHAYPKAIFNDNSSKSFALKKSLFTSLENLTLVPVSEWLGAQLKKSFLSECRIETIHNGIDTEIFTPQNVDKTDDKILVLGVAKEWDDRKGLQDLVKLAENDNFRIVLVGKMTPKQRRKLPSSITAVNHTKDVNEMVKLYSAADVFVNPTYSDNFPTTNLEALACGTPVVTYDTGGSPEALDGKTGIVVRKGDLEELAEAIVRARALKSEDCRQRAVQHFDKKIFKEYISLYHNLLWH